MNLLKKILSIKNIEFFPPKKNKILFIGSHNVDLFYKNILNDQHTICDFESVNLYILLVSLFNKNSKKLRINYYINFIRYTNPVIILTFTDNYKNFYLLKQFFKTKIFISIQNGWRGKLSDFFSEKNLKDFKEEKLQSDYVLTFNDVIGEKFQEIVDCKIIKIGSFRSNIFKIKKFTKKNSVAFISSYKKRDEEYAINEYKILFKDYYMQEKFIVNFLSNYCLKNSLEFFIIPCQSNNEEYNYYKSDQSNKFNMLPKKNRYCSYEYVDDFQYLVGTDTTLSYESLFRKNRIAFFNLRKNFLSKFANDNFDEFRFLWPSKFDKDGPFWTHKIDPNEMSRVLNFVTKCNDSEWREALDNIDKKNYILHDDQNTILKDLLNKHLELNA